MIFNKLFYNDYHDNYIEECQQLNVCGEVIDSYYRLRIAKYRFGIKSYFTFYYDHGDYQSYVSTKTKEDLIKEFHKFICGYKIIKHSDKVTCE